MNVPEMIRIRFLPVSALALALAACSPPADDGAAPAADDTAAVDSTLPPPIKPADVPTRGGDGSPIELTGIAEADLDGVQLDGELACSFAADATTPPILLARGDVASTEPSRGIIKIGDTVETIAATGGFDAMVNGTRFTGKGMQLRVALTGLAEGEGESPPRPATLTADRADGAQRVFAGLWQCGP